MVKEERNQRTKGVVCTDGRNNNSFHNYLLDKPEASAELQTTDLYRARGPRLTTSATHRICRTLPEQKPPHITSLNPGDRDYRKRLKRCAGERPVFLRQGPPTNNRQGKNRHTVYDGVSYSECQGHHCLIVM